MSEVRLKNVDKMKEIDELVQRNLQGISQNFLDAQNVVDSMEESYGRLLTSAQVSYVQIPLIYTDVRDCVQLLIDACDPEKHVSQSSTAINFSGIKLVRKIVLEHILGDEQLLGQKGAVFVREFNPLLEKCYPSIKWASSETKQLKILMEDVQTMSEETHEYFLELRAALSHREVDLLFLQRGDLWLEGGAQLLKKLFRRKLLLEKKKTNRE
ncbi:MAG: hypothetical protein P1V18_04730 [Candidatus Gracilibacteria bacterium]|nr:hypothetical protein [Candidatus Gracilibacteria bacterium]